MESEVILVQTEKKEGLKLIEKLIEKQNTINIVSENENLTLLRKIIYLPCEEKLVSEVEVRQFVFE